MSRNTWSLIKQAKNFNVRIFRVGLAMLTVALLFSATFAVLIFYVYIRQPERDYYATSGIAPPVQLKSMMTPNMSSHALLDSDPSTENDFRAIPQ